MKKLEDKFFKIDLKQVGRFIEISEAQKYKDKSCGVLFEKHKSRLDAIKKVIPVETAKKINVLKANEKMLIDCDNKLYWIKATLFIKLK